MPRKRKQRRAAWASITTIDDGARYRIRYWGKDSKGTYRRMSRTVRGTRKDAERVRAVARLGIAGSPTCILTQKAPHRRSGEGSVLVCRHDHDDNDGKRK